ncbi:hypothetical protein [Yersinia phage MHG19]|nr:hypothetical protein [Yersinia phage MHG19]
MNPFKAENHTYSPDMQALFKELTEVSSKIFLLHAEEKGAAINLDAVSNYMKMCIDFDASMFKLSAEQAFKNIPDTSLCIDEKVAIAAHEAFKAVIR